MLLFSVRKILRSWQGFFVGKGCKKVVDNDPIMFSELFYKKETESPVKMRQCQSIE